ncbi:putative zinc finger protein [Paenibacillus taihuensis]|uniref:Anti-sigma-W factor RsiW n=1 Tax=Paenibacillus taihuensis TaxID=1156355 RepID=A0A3D9RWW6_9BACL|nr:zf-HC2 domain-containing protein [Paenibacillus taihuensis]REE84470.1 putative zinc finger protein [Paenibacillus taihuensis]
MKHWDDADLRNYAEDRLQEQERQEVEAHLAECEPCLLRYMDVLSEAPQIERLSGQAADAITKRVMEQVRTLGQTAAAMPEVQSPPQQDADKAVQRRKKGSRDSRKQALVHYLIAVCVMLLLMSAGVFQRLADQPEHWEAQQLSKRESVTTSIMERTSAVIDSIVVKPNKSTLK